MKRGNTVREISACLSVMCRAFIICIIIAVDCPRLGLMISPRKVKAVITASARAYNTGQSADFKCQLKTDHFTVYDLRFVSVPASLATRGTTKVEDNTTMTLSVTSLSVKDTGTLYCVTSNTTLARKQIFVGAPPVAAYNISCVSHNQEELMCQVQVATRQPQTKWTIEYTNRGLRGVYRTCNRSTICAIHINSMDGDKIFYPTYRHTFRVNATNRYGRATKTFEMDPFLVVKPDQVQDVIAWILNSTCLNVTWRDASDSVVAVQYTVTADTQQVLVAGDDDSKTHWVIVCDLLPYSRVVVSVTSRPLQGGYPSDPISATQTMPEDRPSPPVIQAWSYTTLAAGARRKVAVYWQAIPSNQQHGVIRGFRVMVHRRNTSFVTEHIVPNTSLSVLVDANLSMSVEYVMSVQAWTDVGYSDVTDASRISIPVASQKQTAARWVDVIFVHDDVYDIYWDAVFSSATSTTLLHWCYGQMSSPGYVSCESNIRSRIEGEADGHGVKANVEEKFVTTCSTCVWHFGVSMETDGINTGIVWNKCKFHKFEAPLVNDVVVNRLSDTSVEVTWGVPCRMNVGRPEFIDVAVILGNTDRARCENSHPVKVAAKHDGDSVTLKVGGSSYTVCVRAVGGGVSGPWVRRKVTTPVTVALVPREVIVWVPVSCSTLAAAILITSIYYCRRKKWFAKIQIQLPTLINRLDSPASEEGRFLPPMNLSSETSTTATMKASYRDTSKTVSNLEPRNETVGTGLLTYVIAGDDVSTDNSIDICVDMSSLSSVDGNLKRVGENPDNLAKKHRMRASNFTLQDCHSEEHTGYGSRSPSNVWLQGSCGCATGSVEFSDYDVCVGDPCDTDGNGLDSYHTCSLVRDPVQHGVGKQHGLSDTCLKDANMCM
ncbi:leukemia inhibitory factor receptor-like [Haliotis asinina]|uniref:leukemia inhibitory factor receptor-like n=1 Tax=Haliotis asinina TaxID=109174 RepID=UPI0035319219